MKKSLSVQAALATCLAVSGIGHAQQTETVHDVVLKPLSMVTQVDAGHIVKGYLDTEPIKGQFIQRTSAWIIQDITIQKRLDVTVGVGGIFWYATPGDLPGTNVSYRMPMRFGPGIGRADMTYRFGNDENPMFTLQAGFFPYKYNPDAKNLGEYLLRSGTYPGYLVTGGWNIISEAGYMMQGLRLNMSLWDGKFQSEFLLPMERDMPPIGDLSPTYIATLKPVAGLEFGAGATCNHCIPVRPSKTNVERQYDINDENPPTTVIIKNPDFNSSQPATDLDGLRLDNGAASTYNPRYVFDSTQFYSLQGIKLMGRVSVDPKAYIPMDFLGPQDLRVFAEIALLGVENYPFFYEKRTERMPIMWGLNLPTRFGSFKLLDALSFQMEYYNSPNANGVFYAWNYNVPVPEMFSYNPDAGFTAETRDPNKFSRDHESVTRDNWKWSLYAKKEVYRGLRFYAQVASDHLRLPDVSTAPSNYPLTSRNNGKDWYYLLRLELGI